VPVPGLLAIVIVSVIGAIEEGIQWFLPSRVMDPVDTLFKVLAAVMVVIASMALRWARS
jgi:VanZ family protein